MIYNDILREVFKDILRRQTKLKKLNALFSCQYIDVNELYPRIPFVLLANNGLDVHYPLPVIRVRYVRSYLGYFIAVSTN